MKRRTMQPCHAKITTECAEHGHHVVTMTSGDDSAWLFAELLVAQLKADGHHVLLDRWQDTAEGSVAGDPRSDRRRPNDN